MTRILRREAAKSDLKEIWKYIASDSRERANDFLRALNDKMETLAKNLRIANILSAYSYGTCFFNFCKVML